MPKCKALVFFYDITYKRSLEDIPAMIELNFKTSQSKDMEWCLLGTKIDLEEQRAVLTRVVGNSRMQLEQKMLLKNK